jgi:hypothetical protein
MLPMSILEAGGRAGWAAAATERPSAGCRRTLEALGGTQDGRRRRSEHSHTPGTTLERPSAARRPRICAGSSPTTTSCSRPTTWLPTAGSCARTTGSRWHPTRLRFVRLRSSCFKGTRRPAAPSDGGPARLRFARSRSSCFKG